MTFVFAYKVNYITLGLFTSTNYIIIYSVHVGTVAVPRGKAGLQKNIFGLGTQRIILYYLCSSVVSY